MFRWMFVVARRSSACFYCKSGWSVSVRCRSVRQCRRLTSVPVLGGRQCRRLTSVPVLAGRQCRCLTSSAALPSDGWFSDDDSVPALDWDRLLDSTQTAAIRQEVSQRKGVGDIDRVQSLYSQLQTCGTDCESQRRRLLSDLVAEALRIPNRTRPSTLSADAGAGDTRPLRSVGEKRQFDFPEVDFSRRATKLGMLRTDNLGKLTGTRTYYLSHALAELESALLRYATSRLLQLGFRPVSVPDILPEAVLQACGVDLNTERHMVYRVEPADHNGIEGAGIGRRDLCLSGTSEMALAAMLRGRRFESRQLPLRFTAVSRCYRSEVSKIRTETGIYRVHQFNKVEMFGVCIGDLSASQQLLQEFVEIQQELFESLGLHFTVHDMLPHELGASAYRKLDIEAWMPGRRMYGEVSSASDCTDYQSRRLDVRARCHDADTWRHVHTVNGTACAAPRALIAVVESHQLRDGRVSVPEVLRPFMAGRAVIERPATGRLQHKLLQTYSIELEDDESNQPISDDGR